MNVFHRAHARRRTGAVLVLATLASLLVVAPAARADDDDFDVDCGDVTELIMAIEDANVNDEEDVINLEEDCEYELTEPYNGTNNGLPIIEEPHELSINGNGATIERDENADDFRILEVGPDGILELNELSIENGSAVVVEEDEGILSASAGGILNAGVLDGDDLTVTENRAVASGECDEDECAIESFGIAGGIANVGVGRLSLEGSTVADNTASAEATASCMNTFCVADSMSIGGGIYNEGTLNLERSRVARNTATAIARCADECSTPSSTSLGGGIVNSTFGTLSVERSRVWGNIAAADVTGNCRSCVGGSEASGGGIANQGSLTVEASRVSRNIAITDATIECGQNCDAASFASGGGIFSEGAELTVEASRVERNRVRASAAKDCDDACFTTSFAVGGGIASTQGEDQISSVTNSRMRGNRVTAFVECVEECLAGTTGSGGGYYGSGGTHTLRNNATRANTVLAAPATGNVAQGGGYTFIGGAIATIESDLIEENVANAPGGTAWGGGIYVGTIADETTVTVTDSVITENEVSGEEAEGGGAYVVPGNTLDIFDSEIDDNEPDDCYGPIGGDSCDDD